MKKYLFFAAYALLASAMTFTLSACGDKDDDETGSSMTPEGRAAVAVDLGLPSGTKWATYNIGATKPEDYGSYFAWGETAPKSNYDWNTYKWGTAEDQLTKYCSSSSYGLSGFTDDKVVLDPEDDAASVKWGGDWRMPTEWQFEELIANTNNAWVENYNGTGISGYKFTNKSDASKFIFLPAAGGCYGTSFNGVGATGRYWSGSFDPSNPNKAYYLFFNSGYLFTGSYNRFSGHTVRPVQK